MESVGKKIVKNVRYNAGAQAVIVGVQGVASIILARILTSSDYGIYAFAGVFLNFLPQFSDLGVSSALIYRKDLDSRILNTAYTFRNALSVVLVICALLISFFVPRFFEMKNVDWIIRLLALNFIINGMGFISAALLRRDMNFAGYNVAQLSSSVAGSVLSVALAMMGLGYWSLVYANLLASLAFTITINRVRPVKLALEFHREAAREIWHFGSHLFFSGILIYVLFNAGNFIIGAMRGSEALGYYSLAFNWGTKVPMLLSVTVLSVLFPAFSRIRDDVETLKNTYLQAVQYVSLFSIMLNGTLFCISGEFLKTILGGGTDKWLPALTCFRILCLYGIFRAVLEPIGNVVMALGNTKLLFKANLVASAAQVLLLYPAVFFLGIEGVALTVFASYILQYPIYVRYLRRQIGISLWDLSAALLVPLLSAVVLALWFLAMRHVNIGSSLYDVALKALSYLIIYVLFCGAATKFRLLRDLKLLVGR